MGAEVALLQEGKGLIALVASLLVVALAGFQLLAALGPVLALEEVESLALVESGSVLPAAFVVVDRLP